MTFLSTLRICGPPSFLDVSVKPFACHRCFDLYMYGIIENPNSVLFMYVYKSFSEHGLTSIVDFRLLLVCRQLSPSLFFQYHIKMLWDVCDNFTRLKPMYVVPRQSNCTTTRFLIYDVLRQICLTFCSVLIIYQNPQSYYE